LSKLETTTFAEDAVGLAKMEWVGKWSQLIYWEGGTSLQGGYLKTGFVFVLLAIDLHTKNRFCGLTGAKRTSEKNCVKGFKC